MYFNYGFNDIRPLPTFMMPDMNDQGTMPFPGMNGGMMPVPSLNGGIMPNLPFPCGC